ncbi:adenine phosphoribosyltransferase 1-like isoform X1 [Phragmites australis]|uniref:adenine phosphoribosyltransferase 1-like isoform X1 n=1 Tax=Phragmites australis TaxID=29695 RepID=UPI002D79257F|nr:adenine phosphoribosyltransferase 1-like isoform X1 [Phragmites australis]
MGEEASCDTVSVMEVAANAKQAAKENGRAAAAVAAEAVAAPVAVADPRLHGIFDAIRVVPHFPKPGIMFNDITTLLLRPGVFKDAADMFVERYRGMGIDAVAGIEARGFIFGPAIALAIGAKFIPLRKPRKLPGEVISETYVLEYGTDCLEMHVGAIEPGERVLIVDDLVATGGTLCAAIRLLERAGADVVECACLIGLPKFKDFYKLNGKPVYVLVESRESETEN